MSQDHNKVIGYGNFVQNVLSKVLTEGSLDETVKSKPAWKRLRREIQIGTGICEKVFRSICCDRSQEK